MEEFRGLVDRCLAGNQQAIMELVDRFQGPVFGLCYRMLRHRQDAEDMAQETFVRAVRSLLRWDRQREFLPWLLAIAANRCRTLLSRRMRRPATTSLVDTLPDTAAPEESAERLAEEVQAALTGVRDDYRQAFMMFHVRKSSYLEIAARLGRPVGTIKTWVHRARRELIDQLSKRGALAEVQHALR